MRPFASVGAVVAAMCLSFGVLSPSTQAAPPAYSKLSIHMDGPYTGGAAAVIQAHPRILKIFFPCTCVDAGQVQAARDYKTGTPAGLVVLRIYSVQHFTMSDNPATSADSFWNVTMAPAINAMSAQDKALIDYLEGPNEGDSTPTFSTLAEAQWFNTFWLTLAPHIANAGFKPIFGSIAVGNPPGTPAEIHAALDAVVPALRLCKSLGGGWGYHDYSGPSMTKDLGVEIFFSLRYRQYYDYFATAYPDLNDLLLIGSEGGGFYGWTQVGAAYFQDWLQWHDEQIQQDPYFIGDTLFEIGDPNGWGDFDLEPIAGWLANYIATSSAPTAPPAPTGLAATPGDTQVALSWNPSSGAATYNVKRSMTSGGPYSTIAPGLATTDYTNTGLTNGTTYYYVVSASNSHGESPNSSQVSATPTGSMNGNTPTGQNLALASTQVTTDSIYGAGWEGGKAVDGVISGTSKWVSNGNSPPHWLALDLGASLTVNGYIVRHAGAGGEPAYYNTQQFQIQSGTSLSGPWTDETVVNNAAQASVTARSYITPKTLRYIRLYITDAGIDNYTRIPEFEIWGVSGGGGVQMNGNVPSGVNLATASTQVGTDSNYGAGWEGNKAIDGVTSGSSKWVSNGNSPPHWLKLDLGANKTVNGYVVRHAGAGGEATYYNTQAFAIQVSSSYNGPWTDHTVVDNTAQASVTNRSYVTPQTVRYVRLNITDAGIDNYTRIPEFEVIGPSGGAPATVTEDFNAMPSWSSSFDAAWGSAASWSIVSGGQAGNALQVTRGSQGSSAKAKVFTITPSTNYTISIYIRCPSFGGGYWAECAYKLGSNTAQSFDQDPGSWTMIKKFDNGGTNGNGDTWTQYSLSFNSGSNTQITVAHKLGSSGGGGPTVRWDTLRVQ